MSTDERTRFLQQIPVFALRQLVGDHYTDDEGEAILRARFQTSLGRKPRQAQKAVTRLTRQELTLLINACPEIETNEISDSFERYRYGSHPSFYIFLFDARKMDRQRLAAFGDHFTQALQDDNQDFEESAGDDLPRVRNLSLIDFIPLESASQLFEGTYRFLNRIDFIDAAENAVSIYETMYGFFWIGASEGYVTIHARKPEILRGLKLAIEEATAVLLTPLVISKQFKNALAFLQQDRLRSSRLHEPNPSANRFRSLTIADPNAYQKGYLDFEKAYPELRSTRYHVNVGDKKTTLTIHLSRGSLSLAGRLQASEFRGWAVESLREVLRVVQEFRAVPAQYIETVGLRQAPAMAAYAGAQQKDMVLALLSDLLNLKQTGLQLGSLSADVLDLVQLLKRDFAVQLPCVCSESNDEDETLFACPVCDETDISISKNNGRLQLACNRPQKHWHELLPFTRELECGETLIIDDDYLQRQLLLLPREKLLSTLAQLFNNHPGGYNFDIRSEGFFIRGPNLYHHTRSNMQLTMLDPRQRIYIEQINQNVEKNYGEITGVLLPAS